MKYDPSCMCGTSNKGTDMSQKNCCISMNLHVGYAHVCDMQVQACVDKGNSGGGTSSLVQK